MYLQLGTTQQTLQNDLKYLIRSLTSLQSVMTHLTASVPLSGEVVELSSSIVSILGTLGANFDCLICFVRIQL